MLQARKKGETWMKQQKRRQPVTVKSTSIEKTSDDHTSSNSDDVSISQAAKHVLHHVKRVRSGKNQGTVLMRTGNIDASVEPDSGSCANIIDEY